MESEIMDAVSARLQQAGHLLPAPPSPQARYAPYSTWTCAQTTFVSISGQTSRVNGAPMAGFCHGDSDIAQGKKAAVIATLNALAILKVACGGDLSRVKQITRLRGYVRSTPAFTAQSTVLDGASEVLALAFPTQALPARTAVGVSALPGECLVEIEIEAIL